MSSIYDSSNNAESSDLSTHVSLCSSRYQTLIERIDRIEHTINNIIHQGHENKKILTGIFGIVVIGIVTLITTILIKFPN